MITFLLCLAALVVAYFTYGKYIERQAGVDDSIVTPCHRCADGVDYIEMPRWRVFLVQLLNIAGTGPIFGAILGACFGPVAFLWITIGGIFFGAMHDYLSGMMILRHDGKSLPEVIGDTLGKNMRTLVRWFAIALMIIVGAVFMVSPAGLLAKLTDSISIQMWLYIILSYYIIATVLPVNKVIGKIYPIFGATMLIMALGLLGVLFFEPYVIPEMSFHNFHSAADTLPIFPTVCITIACGAISGFHATQSPMMARCVDKEHQCRSVFFGAMITESIIALIWAAIAMAFFGAIDALNGQLAANGNNPAWVVSVISTTTLGKVGGILAILGVVAAPITSGDTAFRSARLMLSDMFNFNQRPMINRLLVSLPLFVAGYILSQIDFDIIWRYFAWSNQTLATITLWAIYVWLYRRGANVWVALIPAIIMTDVVSTFVFQSGQFIGMGATPVSYIAGAACTLVLTFFMIRYTGLPYIGKKSDANITKI